MFRVRKDLCAGCGLCVESCPRGAIMVESGQARIEQVRCNGCGNCVDVCLQGAIVKLALVSKNEVGASVASLKQRTNELIERIERLRKTGKVKL